MTKLTTEQRETLRIQVDALNLAWDEIHQATEPFRLAKQRVCEAKEALLVAHGVELYGRCEEGCLIFYGDRAHVDSDGPDLCEKHAPTWRDIKAQFEECPELFDDESDTDEEKAAERERLKRVLAEMEAAGTLDEKRVWVVEE